MRRHSTMVGREREIALFQDAMASGDGSILIVGDGGIGKTRFVMEALALERALGCICLTGGCLPLSQPLPLLPITDALRNLTRQAGGRLLEDALDSAPPYVRTELSRLLPDLTDSPAAEVDGLPRDGDRQRLFAAVDHLLRGAARSAPVALVVEDLHWADQSTLDLLTYLQPGLVDASITLVMTCRIDEADVPEHLQVWLSNARRTDVTEIHLRGLDRDDVASMLRDLLDEPLSSGLIDEFAARTGGNPFFVEQLAAALPAHGQASIAPLPHGLAEFLTTRIRRISPPARAVLAALAVVGHPIDETLTIAVAGLPGADVRTALRELHVAKLLADTDRGSAYAIRHALLAEAVRLDLLPGERADLHFRAAGALEAAGTPSAVAEAAEHWRAANRPLEELRATVTAATAASAIYAYDEAANFWERAVALSEQLPDAASTLGLNEVDLYLSAANAVAADAGRLDDGLAIAERALQRLGDTPDPWDAARLRSEVSGFRHLWYVASAVPLLMEALAIFETLPPSAEYGQALTRYAYYLQDQLGDHAASAAPLTRALEVAEEVGDLAGAIRAVSHLAKVHFVAGEITSGFDRLHRGRLLCRELQATHQDYNPALRFATWDSDACIKTGRLDEAERLALDAIALASTSGRERSFAVEMLLSNAVEARLERGDVERATYLMATIPAEPDDESSWVRLTSWMDVDVVAGRLESARERMRRVRGVNNSHLAHDRDNCQTAARVLIWSGDFAGAVDVVLGCGRQCTGNSEALFCGELLVLGARAAADLAERARARRDQAELSVALGKLEQLEAICAEMGERPFIDHPYIVRIPADRGQWHAERQRARGIADIAAWHASAEAWDALGRPYRAAYAWWRCAETTLMAGNSAAESAEPLRRAAERATGFVPLVDAITALAKRARITLEDPNAQPTSADRATEPSARDPYGLTDRERHVLALLADGRSNSQIGAELFISHKTASVHVTNILRKLGADNRTHAATLAERAGLLTSEPVRRP